MSVISTITPKPIPKVQTKASILKFSQQNLFLKMFFKLFRLWLTQFLFYIFPHCSTFFFINEIFKGIFFLMVQNYYVIRGQHYVKSVQIRSYFWSIFSCIWTEYRQIWNRNNSAFEHFSRSVIKLSWFACICFSKLLFIIWEQNQGSWHL